MIIDLLMTCQGRILESMIASNRIGCGAGFTSPGSRCGGGAGVGSKSVAGECSNGCIMYEVKGNYLIRKS